MKNLFNYLLLIAVLLISSCSGYEPKPDQQKEQTPFSDKEKDNLKEALIKQNQIRIREELARVASYVNKSGLKMNKTETGLYYLITKVGNGPKPTMLSEVALKYKISLLDGTYCYSSDSTELLNLTVGQSNEPSGLQEGLLNIPQGSDAIIIVPSYLAYGLTGDGDKIPGGESLVYQLTLVKVSSN